MKKIITIVLLIFLYTPRATAQKKLDKLWTKVEQFELDGLPKSALTVVEDIYKKAVKKNNSPQIIKSLFYKSKFALTLEENAQLKVIERFKKQIAASTTPTKNVLQNILANLYWQYFKQHRYQFYNRTKTAHKVNINDFRSWDLETLFQEIHSYFKASLADETILQKMDIHEFSDILQLEKTSSTYTPTLFDFLANNALQFYKTSEHSITKPANQFRIDSAIYLSDAIPFSGLQITSKDRSSLQLHALQTYQKLIELHLKTGNKDALANIDIQRINFVHQHAIFKDKNNVELKTLQTAQANINNHKASGLYAFEIAEIYKNKARNQKALAVCRQIIKDFPKSLGQQKCEILQKQIKQKTLAIKAEKYIPIDKNSRLLVRYKNTDTLYFTAYKINQKQQEKLHTTYAFKDRKNLIQTLQQSTTWHHILRNENDYIQHSTEVIVPKLKSGLYLIVASESERLQEDSVYGTTTLQVTNLALVKNTFNNMYNYQVVDRYTGQPIKNAKLKLENKERNTGKYIHKKLTTDKNGFASFKSDDSYNNVNVEVHTTNDFASFGNQYFYHQYDKNKRNDAVDDITIKPFVFTDRSIYRPGQTVHFKAIVIKKQGNTSKVVKDKFITVYLEDVNGKDIDSVALKLNEFGAVAGKFILPNNGLTGEFTIYVDESEKHNVDFYDDVYFDDNYAEILVEEYKRPKFKTKFNPITNSYTINDSIKVNGFAKAFSGANISDANVVYRVHRKVQYPSWYYWRRPNPNSSSQEITSGETITDSTGNFSIHFKAIPDESVDKESIPIFKYEITADVTDINGETRSATTIIKVGYHSLIASIGVANKIDKTHNETTIKVDTKNLNNEFVSAKGTLKIYKLQAPKNPLRKRPWPAPDYQDISKNTFRTLFPNDPYTNEEANEQNWAKEALVASYNFDTSKAKKIKLNAIKNWISGKYLVVLETKDKFNQTVKDEKRIELFSSKEKKVADSKLFAINTDKTWYAIDDVVELQIGSASKNITVVLQIEKNHKIVDTKLIHINNTTKTIKIPVDKKDVGGFAIKYHFVNYNDFKSGSLLINVPHPQEKKLDIETNIFRDKLQPGQDETWSFTIKDDKNNAIAAEVLASMYDASLDEFKNHNWYFNPTTPKPTYYSYQTSNANKSFKNSNFKIHNIQRNYYRFPNIQNDKYNWFGFSLNNKERFQNEYLLSIYKKRKAKKLNVLVSKSGQFNGKINGIVTDEYNEPLPGVSIGIKGTNNKVITNFDGQYSIPVEKGKTLVFNYLGFSSLIVKILDFSELNVALKENAEHLDEVVVIGYGSMKKKSVTGAVRTVTAKETEYDANVTSILSGKVAGVSITGISGQAASNQSIKIRGAATAQGNNQPLYVVDGVIVDSFDKDSSDLVNISILKEDEATAIYGSRGANGVIIITTKSGQEKIDAALLKVQARKNFKETAFFFPKLKTDKNGKVSFTFTMPEALTRWKLQLLAHTKNLKSASKTLQTVTQKELMVVPNAPRFLREKDTISLSAKITNLTNNKLSGFAKLILTNPISGKEIKQNLLSKSGALPLREMSETDRVGFTVDKDGNATVSWNLAIPENIQAVQYKIVAKAGNFSDGEQNVLPVLTNRMLVTETLPMWIRSKNTKTFTLDKLKNNASSTLKNHKLTLEMTSNPAWYAIQSLPYLMEYPYECAEQTFSKYYANTLANFVVNANPKIQDVFHAWHNSDALVSNLEKNQELKSLLIQETPWLRDAQSETEQKKRIALLFDLTKMKNEQQKAINKLQDIQLSSGGFPWFKGGKYASNFITQHIATGFGHLQKLRITDLDKSTQKMMQKSVRFLDDEILAQYQKLLKKATILKEKSKTTKEGNKKYKAFLRQNHLNYATIQYLYMRSFYVDMAKGDALKEAVLYYQNQTKVFWNTYNLYAKAQIALSLFRTDKKQTAKKIVRSLKENSITSDELGMYWKSNTAGYYYYQAPIETHALLIEAFSEILDASVDKNKLTIIDNLNLWLLKNKQTNSWKTTKATTEAVYALLLNGSDWLSVTEMVDIKIGNNIVDPSKIKGAKVEAGSGYFKTSWNANTIQKEMAEVTISKKGKGIAWGALYWQYFEDLDKITSAETPLKLNKKLFKKVNSDTGKELQEINKNSSLKVGDLVTVRIELHSDRDLEFIHLKDMRASGLEPINVISKYKWQDNLGYYESTKDASTNFFFDRLPKGVYVFEYDVRVNNAGFFSNGISTIQSMYAPEFSSHSEGIRLKINDEFNRF
ncbi:alpha-2-macroglobulin family protein [Polaribacter sp. M15]